MQQGTYLHDKRHGPGILTYPDGKSEWQLWENGELLSSQPIGIAVAESKPEEKSEAQSPDEKKEDEMLSPAFVPTPEGESGDFSDFRTALNKLTKQFKRK